MRYTYTSKNMNLISTDIEEDGLRITNNDDNFFYKYEQITIVNLVLEEGIWFGIYIFFNDGRELKINGLTSVGNKILSKTISQNEEYLDWIKLFHEKLVAKNLSNKIEFKQGNSQNAILTIAGVTVGLIILIPICLQMNRIGLVFLIMAPAVGMLFNLNFSKPYNPNKLPEKYLPKI